MSATQSSPSSGAAAGARSIWATLRCPRSSRQRAATTVLPHVHGRRCRRRRRRHRSPAPARRSALAPPVRADRLGPGRRTRPRSRRARGRRARVGVAHRGGGGARGCGALRRRAGRHRDPLRRRPGAPWWRRSRSRPSSPPRSSSDEGGVAALAEKLAPAVVHLVVTSDGGHLPGLRRRGPRRRPRLHERPRGRRRHLASPWSWPTAVASTGEVVGADLPTDVAVVAIDADDLTVAVLGSSADLAVGSPAMALGWPTEGGGAAVGHHGRGERGRAPTRCRRRVAPRPDPDRRADRGGLVRRPARRRERRRDRDHHGPGRATRPGSASPRRSTSSDRVAVRADRVGHGHRTAGSASRCADLSMAEADADGGVRAAPRSGRSSAAARPRTAAWRPTT